MRFIVESTLSGRWTCYEETRLAVCCDGMSPAHAFERYCATHGISAMTYRWTQKAGRYIYAEVALCNNCGGTGRMNDHATGETCPTCAGTGNA